MHPVDDIPEAARDTPSQRPGGMQAGGRWLALAASLGLVALVSGGALAWYLGQRTSQAEGVRQLRAGLQVPTLTALSGTESTEDTESTDSPLLPASGQVLLGHRAYREADVNVLVPVTADGRIRLQPAAAQRYRAMVEAAANNDIQLAALSGYRTVEEQRYLFFGIKEQRAQDARTRAEVSAPPGYSEHHTGYAIDIGDATRPATHLEESFAETAAYEWLTANAPRYGFELSFPRNNSQGVSFEPWHWRFVGDQASLEMFYQEQRLPDQN